MSEIEVRAAASDEETTAAGALTAEAYHADRLIDDGDEYRDELLDAGRRSREATLLVALQSVPGGASVVVGTVTLAPHGSSYAEVAEPGEVEIRMLAVAPEARRQGVAEALMRACLREAVVLGSRIVVLSTLDAMVGAHRLYERLEFRRVPERDWHHEGIALRVFVWTAPEPPGAAVESATWQPVRVHDVDGWRAGISGGLTLRANSVIAADVPTDVGTAIARVERLYAEVGLSAVFRIDRESSPRGLSGLLSARGYRRVSGALVMVTNDLGGVAPIADRAEEASLTVVSTNAPNDPWLRLWLAQKSASAVDTTLAASILGGSRAAYLTAYSTSYGNGQNESGDESSLGTPVGVIRAAISDDWVALACLVVVGSERRRGIARTLTRAAVREAAGHGVARAFLQVEHANFGAMALYERLGFRPADSYSYLARADAV